MRSRLHAACSERAWLLWHGFQLYAPQQHGSLPLREHEPLLPCSQPLCSQPCGQLPALRLMRTSLDRPAFQLTVPPLPCSLQFWSHPNGSQLPGHALPSPHESEPPQSALHSIEPQPFRVLRHAPSAAPSHALHGKNVPWSLGLPRRPQPFAVQSRANALQPSGSLIYSLSSSPRAQQPRLCR